MNEILDSVENYDTLEDILDELLGLPAAAEQLQYKLNSSEVNFNE